MSNGNKIIEALERKPFAVIGHRGAAGLEPENTIRSIKRALEIGVDIIEVDVRGTRDGRLILLHDEDFSRLANVSYKARELSLSEIRDRIRIMGEKVATLDDALTVIDGVAGLFIEIKEPDTTDVVLDTLNAYGATNWTAIVSFHDEALLRAKKRNPNIITGLIYFKPPGRIFDAKKLQAEIVIPRYNLATEKANKLAHKLGFYVVTWTVNDVSLAEKLVKAGVDGIASDYPDKMVAFREALRNK